MSAFPKLNVWPSRPSEEFLHELRYAAVDAGAQPAIIDAIDELLEPSDILDSPEVIEALAYGEQRMFEAVIEALKKNLSAVGLTKNQRKRVVAIVEELGPS